MPALARRWLAARARQRTLDAGDTLRQGVQVTAQLAQLRDYAAMQVKISGTSRATPTPAMEIASVLTSLD